MGLWPHVLCSLVAIWLLVRWRQGDGRAWVNAAGIVLVTAVALLWHERAVLIAAAGVRRRGRAGGRGERVAADDRRR